VADKIAIPFIAWRFADGRGLAAALGVGRDRDQHGHPFMCTRRGADPQNVKAGDRRERRPQRI